MDRQEFRAAADRLFPGPREWQAEVLTNFFPHTKGYLHDLLKGRGGKRKLITYEHSRIMEALLRQRFGITTTNSRPVILGTCDYYSEDPHHVYFPNRGLGGLFWNLLSEKGVSQSDYLRAFDRRQLTPRYGNERMVRRRARAAAPAMWESLRGRHVMIVDSSASTFLGAKSTYPFKWEKKDGVWYFLLPTRARTYSTDWKFRHILALGLRLETLYLGYISGP